MEIDKVIKLIHDLTARTVSRGCTEAEAFTAAQKVGELLKVYNLSMDRVFLGAAKCITGRIVTDNRRRGPISDCMWQIGGFCDCKVWFTWDLDHRISYYLFGLETDVEMAIYLHSVIAAAMETESAVYQQSEEYQQKLALQLGKCHRRGHGKHLMVSFRRGMAQRIASRLIAMTRTRHEEEEEAAMKIPLELDIEPVPTSTPGCTSLVVVKRKKVDEEYEKLGLKLKNYKSSGSHRDRNAYKAGKEAGDRVNLSRPIPSGPVSGLLK